ncbi:MAG: FixH family protein [Gammaproteobacteria bacterium]
MDDAQPATPWYREPWPWLLMIAPAAAVVGGIFTWWLAAHTNHALVVDDYYREGRAINQQLARDVEATRMGLSATLANAPGAGSAPSSPAAAASAASAPRAGVGSVVLELKGTPGDAGWPEFLDLRLVHATESALDAELRLAHQGNGRYLGAGVLPASGHWIVQLEDPGRHWRLIARSDRFDAPLVLRADPVLAGGGR